MRRYQRIDRIDERPEDLTAVDLAAYAPDADGGALVRYPGTGAADGTFVIPDVPMGPYYLEIARTPIERRRRVDVYWLASHVVDLGTSEAGGPLDDDAPAPTTIQLMMDGLAPWAAGDGVRFYAEDQGRGMDVSTGAGTGDTAIVASFLYAPPLVADTVHLVQTRVTQRAANWSTRAAIRTATRPGITQTSGITLVGSFEVGDVKTVTPSVEAPALAMHLGIFDPGTHAAEIVASPVRRSAEGRPGITLMTDVRSYVETGPAQEVSLRDGLPPWERHSSIQFVGTRRQIISPNFAPTIRSSVREDFYAFPGTGTYPPQLVLNADNVLAMPVVSRGGAPFSDAVVKPGELVSFRWDPVPGAAYYEVVLDALNVVGPNFGDATVTLLTTETSATVPTRDIGDIAMAVVSITAVSTGDYRGRPRDFVAPGKRSRTGAGVLVVSATCGNGTMDEGEQCDPGATGETAACDYDCTMTMCLDGVVNRTAGETCDVGVSVPACPACGM